MGHFGVLGHGQHEAPRDAHRVPHQEHAVPLPLQQGNGFIAFYPAPVPTIAVFGIKISGHVCDLLPEAGGLFRSATHTKLWGTGRCGRKSKSRPTGATRRPEDDFRFCDRVHGKHVKWEMTAHK